MAYSLVELNIQRIHIVLRHSEKIVPNKFASCVIITLLADVTLS